MEVVGTESLLPSPTWNSLQQEAAGFACHCVLDAVLHPIAGDLSLLCPSRLSKRAGKVSHSFKHRKFVVDLRVDTRPIVLKAEGMYVHLHDCLIKSKPRGSIYTTIMELGSQNHNRDGLLGPNSIIVVYTLTNWEPQN